MWYNIIKERGGKSGWDNKRLTSNNSSGFNNWETVTRTKKEVSHQQGEEIPPPKYSISQPLENMKQKYISIILIGLVVLNILDGSFKNPSTLDYIKFILLGAALILSLLVEKRKWLHG